MTKIVPRREAGWTEEMKLGKTLSHTQTPHSLIAVTVQEETLCWCSYQELVWPMILWVLWVYKVSLLPQKCLQWKVRSRLAVQRLLHPVPGVRTRYFHHPPGKAWREANKRSPVNKDWVCHLPALDGSTERAGNPEGNNSPTIRRLRGRGSSKFNQLQDCSCP